MSFVSRKVAQQNRSFASFRAISALILREMATRNSRSPGGWLWSVLDPLGTTLLLAIAMWMLMKVPPLGVSFVLFKATGMLPFAAWNMLHGASASALNFSRPLLRYPGVTWADALLARIFTNMLMSLIVCVLIFAAILLWSDTRTLPDLPVILLAMLLGVGVGTFNIWCFMRYPAWEHVWGICNRPMFLASGVLFLFESLPQWLRDLLWYNPLMHIIALMRAGFYPLYHPDWLSLTYVFGFAMIPLAAGLLLVRRDHVDLLNL